MQLEIRSYTNGRTTSVKFIGDTSPDLMNEFANQIPAYFNNQSPLHILVDRATQGNPLQDLSQVRSRLPIFNHPKFG